MQALPKSRCLAPCGELWGRKVMRRQRLHMEGLFSCPSQLCPFRLASACKFGATVRRAVFWPLLSADLSTFLPCFEQKTRAGNPIKIGEVRDASQVGKEDPVIVSVTNKMVQFFPPYQTPYRGALCFNVPQWIRCVNSCRSLAFRVVV
jgi:hypothetical protein